MVAVPPSGTVLNVLAGPATEAGTRYGQPAIKRRGTKRLWQLKWARQRLSMRFIVLGANRCGCGSGCIYFRRTWLVVITWSNGWVGRFGLVGCIDFIVSKGAHYNITAGLDGTSDRMDGGK